jgi:micrococcal nuclease
LHLGIQLSISRSSLSSSLSVTAGRNLGSEIEQLGARIGRALATRQLTQWQRNFLEDVRSRIDRYGDSTRLSDRQRQKLEEIIAVKAAPSPLPAVRRSKAFHQRRRRESSFEFWGIWPRWYRRDYQFAAALIVVGFIALLQLIVPHATDGQRTSNILSVTSGEYGADDFPSQNFTVTDGDTIRVSGELKGTRLVGFNAPEVFSPKCEYERQLGGRATARVKQLVSTSSTRIRKVSCACEPGTEGTKLCNYGRSCGVLLAGGRDVGQILISEGLAVPFVCGSTSCPATPRPWCG